MKTKLIQKIKNIKVKIYSNCIITIEDWSRYVASGDYITQEEIYDVLIQAISQSKEELVEEIKKTIEKKKDDLVAQEKFCSNCIKERDEEDDELTGEIEPCQTHLISWFNIQTLEELLEDLNKK